jgi:phage/plasmid primase-like uncharacterized protein
MQLFPRVPPRSRESLFCVPGDGLQIGKIRADRTLIKATTPGSQAKRHGHVRTSKLPPWAIVRQKHHASKDFRNPSQMQAHVYCSSTPRLPEEGLRLISLPHTYVPCKPRPANNGLYGVQHARLPVRFLKPYFATKVLHKIVLLRTLRPPAAGSI